MTEEVTEEATTDVEFAVALVRQSDGNIVLGTVPGLPEASNLDQIYEMMCTLKRNFESQQTVAAFMQALEAVQQAQQPVTSEGRTKSGIVVPR